VPIPFVFILTALLCSAAAGAAAQTERQHTVRSGQSLVRIAKQYRVDPIELAAANGLRTDAEIKRGQKLTVPEEGCVYVTPGQTLGRIAKANRVMVEELAKLNKIQPTDTLQIGQRLILPGYRPSKAEKRWGPPARRGVLKLYRIWSAQSMTLRMVDHRGKVRPAAIRQMREFLRPRDSRRRKLPNERLLRLLAQVSDHFGGRAVHVVSGYRLPGGNTRETSRHVAGEAIDFRIPGVTLEELRDYCQRFDHVGVGYYPRSHFVHLDVRRQNARWTDWSLPGQKAILAKPDDIDDSSRPVAPEPIMPAHEYNIEADPPAPDDGQPPIEDPPQPPPVPSSTSKARG
jgi:uncharacterized protein YcbK (DUF882 family)